MSSFPSIRPSRYAWALLPLAAACGGDATDEPAATAQSAFCTEAMAAVEAHMAEMAAERGEPDDPRYGGTVVLIGGAEIPNGMNAFQTADFVASQHQTFVVGMTLVAYDENLDPRPWLAESWEVSDDGTQLTFRLRDDVYWHDGERTDAYDVAFTFLRASHPETGFPNAAMWARYGEGEAGVEVLDSLTVRFNLTPHAEFMDTWRAVAIMPEHLLGEVPPAELAGHPYGTECPVGNGPFVFESHRSGESWSFRANPAFPEALGGRPYVDRYVYRILQEPAARLAELQTGAGDVLILAAPSQATVIEADPDLRLVHFPGREVAFVGWNTRRPALSDARVRRALTMAIDRQTMIAALREGYGDVAHATVPEFHFGHAPDSLVALPFDRSAAAALLDEAGWTDRDGDGVRENEAGEPLSFAISFNPDNQGRRDIAQILQAQLAEIGVDVQMDAAEWGSILGRILDPASRDFDAVVMAWVHDFRVDDSDLFHSERVDGPYQWAGLEDPQVDRWLDTLQTVQERDAARPLWWAYQQAVSDAQPYAFLYFADRIHGVSTRLNDVEMDARGEWLNLREWWIDPARRGR